MLCRVALVNLARRLLVAACCVPCSPILVTLMKEALDSSETSVLTRATRRNIPEDTILHSHRRENLKSYNGNTDLPTVGYHATQQYQSGERIHGNIRLRLPSSDSLQSNTSQYIHIYIYSIQLPVNF
jgi:hypothetical protein